MIIVGARIRLTSVFGHLVNVVFEAYFKWIRSGWKRHARK